MSKKRFYTTCVVRARVGLIHAFGAGLRTARLVHHVFQMSTELLWLKHFVGSLIFSRVKQRHPLISAPRTAQHRLAPQMDARVETVVLVLGPLALTCVSGLQVADQLTRGPRPSSPPMWKLDPPHRLLMWPPGLSSRSRGWTAERGARRPEAHRWHSGSIRSCRPPLWFPRLWIIQQQGGRHPLPRWHVLIHYTD